jgi:hypothetical protein
MPVSESIKHVKPDRTEKAYRGETEETSRVEQKDTVNKYRMDERFIVLSVLGFLLFAVYCLQHILTPARAFRHHEQVRIRGNSLVLERVVPTAGIQEAKDKAFKIPDRLRPFFYAPVPINIADQQLLETIRGIGRRLSLEIIQTRTLDGPFTGPEDLLRVHGIGPKRMDEFSKKFSYEVANQVSP